MALIGRFLTTSVVIRSKPGDLLRGYLCMRYLISLGEKDLTDGEGKRGALRAVFTRFMFSKSTISECG